MPQEMQARTTVSRRATAFHHQSLDEVLAKYDAVLNTYPHLAFGYAVRGLIQSDRKDYQRCVADGTEALRLGFRRVEVLMTRARALDALQRPEEAIVDCTAILAVEPVNIRAYNCRGLMRVQIGMLDEGLADLNKASS